MYSVYKCMCVCVCEWMYSESQRTTSSVDCLKQGLQLFCVLQSQVVCRIPGILLSFCRWLGLQLHVATLELSRFWGSELGSSYFMASALLTEVPPQPLPLIFNFASKYKDYLQDNPEGTFFVYQYKHVSCSFYNE